jgi:glycosyltransferase involved in cell wall biosynthesis
MRVALVAMETVHHRETDGNRRFQHLAEGLVDAGHEVTVFCSRWWDGQDTVFHPEDVRYRAVTATLSPGSFSLRLPLVLARYGPDVVHARPSPPQTVVAASVGGTLSRSPLVLEWFGDEGVEENTRMNRAVAREPQMVITPSEMVRTEVRELGSSDEHTKVVPESIDFSLVESVEPAEEVDLVYAHTLDESANVESLFLGLAELRDRDWSATIIGDGPHRETYERQAADLRIDDRVTFVGACDRETRLCLYRGAHAFVQTAYREYFATELLWALACGCIGLVEYQARSSAHELIENYGRSFRVTNPQQLADAIVDAGDYEHRTVDESWSSYDREDVLNRYTETYDELVADFGFL